MEDRADRLGLQRQQIQSSIDLFVPFEAVNIFGWLDWVTDKFFRSHGFGLLKPDNIHRWIPFPGKPL